MIISYYLKIPCFFCIFLCVLRTQLSHLWEHVTGLKPPFTSPLQHISLSRPLSVKNLSNSHGALLKLLPSNLWAVSCLEKIIYICPTCQAFSTLYPLEQFLFQLLLDISLKYPETPLDLSVYPWSFQTLVWTILVLKEVSLQHLALSQGKKKKGTHVEICLNALTILNLALWQPTHHHIFISYFRNFR